MWSKLEAPGAARNRCFEVMAALAHIVRAQTTVPLADVVSVDSSRRRWPWNVLIESQLPGQTWAGLYSRLGELQRMAAQRQLGQAAAQLHTLTVDGYGEFGVNGRVLEPGAAVATLRPNGRSAAYERILTAITSARCWMLILTCSCRLLAHVFATKT